MAESGDSVKYCLNGEPQIKVYVCDLCNECYTMEKSLKLHRRSHKALSCDVSHGVFSSEGDLTAHCQSHTRKERSEVDLSRISLGDTQIAQMLCKQKIYIAKSDDDNSLKTSAQKSTVKFEKYDKVFDTKCNMQTHNSVNPKGFTSKQCNENCIRESDFASHSCSNVGVKIFKDSSEINSLNNDHQKSSEKSFICNSCNIKYNDKTSLEAHTEKIKVTCATCNKTFDSKCSQQAHKCFQSIKGYLCDICNAYYTVEKSLKLHKRFHKTLTGDVCYKHFLPKDDFTIHCHSHARNDISQENSEVKLSSFAQMKNSEILLVQKNCYAKYDDSLPKTHAEKNVVIHEKYNKRFDSKSNLQTHDCINSKEFVCKQQSDDRNPLNNDHQENSKKSFICNLCNIKYDKISFEAHTEKNAVTCITCNKSFDSKCSQQAHNCVKSINSYVCDICNSRYTTEKSLKLHCRYHGSFKCTFCKKEFSLESDLTMHYHGLHEIKKFGINIRHQESKVSETLHIDHLQNSEKSFICAVCIGKYSDEVSFKCHIEKTEIKCENCDKIFDSVCSLQSHKHSHSLKGYVCNICNKSFKLRNSLGRHYLSHKAFRCTVCRKGFWLKNDLSIHFFSHTTETDNISSKSNKMDSLSADYLQNSPKLLTSDTCKNYNSKHNLQNHDCINSVSRYICNVCNEYFILKKTLKEHHCSSKMFTCGICKTNFPSKNYLISHRCSHVTNDTCQENNTKDPLTVDQPQNSTKLFTSSICDTKYNNDITLKMHIEKRESNEIFDSEYSLQNYSCNNSAKDDACFFPDCLNEHDYACKKITCGDCKKEFSSNNDLSFHCCSHSAMKVCPGISELDPMSSDHCQNKAKEKNEFAKVVFVCNICNTKYSDKTSLNAHKEKCMLICEICKKSFNSKCRLQAHSCISADAESSCIKSEKEILGESQFKTRQETCKAKTVPCKICNLLFEDQDALKRHHECHADKKISNESNEKHKSQAHIKSNQLKHSADVSFSCHLCKKVFRGKTEFAYHSCILKKHEMFKLKGAIVIQLQSQAQATKKQCKPINVPVQNFVCNICEQTFSKKESLNLHYWTHTTEKTFKCDICEKSFKHKASIKAHYEKHIATKKHICKFCQKCFSRKRELTIHYSFHKKNN